MSKWYREQLESMIAESERVIQDAQAHIEELLMILKKDEETRMEPCS